MGPPVFDDYGECRGRGARKRKLLLLVICLAPWREQTIAFSARELMPRWMAGAIRRFRDVAERCRAGQSGQGCQAAMSEASQERGQTPFLKAEKGSDPSIPHGHQHAQAERD